MTPVERMARAICRADHPCWSAVDVVMESPSYADGREGDERARTPAGVYRDRARAALEAIREPSEAMIEAGSLAFSEAAFECGKPSKEALLHAWQVMIDKALSET